MWFVAMGVKRASWPSDGRAISGTSFFAEPFRDVEITVAFGDSTVMKQVNGVAGGQAILEVQPSEATPVTSSPSEARFVTAAERRATPSDPTPMTDPESAGLNRVWAIGAAAITVGLAGLTVWSGVDTLAGVDAYEANPTQEGLDAGTNKEIRTNVLIGVTAAVGAAAVALAIFTDWSGGDDEEDIQTAVWVDGTGGGFAVGGRL